MRRLLIILLTAQALCGKMTHIDDLIVHDPCILPDASSGKYYIYRSFRPYRYGEPSKPAGIQVFKSKDLIWQVGDTGDAILLGKQLLESP